ncbi:tetratricopeptide repeat protein [Prochlorococcus marinus]|uniref:tetratricopeptide repeat protein n=1 Tax=Prochlorococcus marinus TaxID=1219 RepID=UPI0022B45DB6|nr:tetratricopeptide repeat protein [Prochlorococcus marinus]
MNSSNQEEKGKKKVTEVKTYPVPYDLEEIKENITVNTNTSSTPSKDQIINQAFNLHSQGNISEAAKLYQYCINQGFNDHRVFSNYGTILRDLGKLQEAEISYRKAIEIKPDYSMANYNLGLILKDIGKLQEAEISTRKAIELNPDFAMAHSNLGLILKDIGKLQEAEISTRKAIELKPDYSMAHYNLGLILKDIDKLQEAEISTRKAIEIKPDYAEAYSNLGNILKDIGKLQEAEMSYRKAIEIKPDYSMANYNLGNILNDLGKLEEAEFSYRKAIEINPDYANAHLNLGNTLKNLGKLQEAEFSYRKAIEINPDFAMAHYNLGLILKDIDKLQEAEISTRKAIELKPDFAEAHSNRGVILINLGKLKEAELSLNKAIEINSNLTIVYYTLSKFKKSKNTKEYKKQIFSKTILNNKTEADKVNIYFARANFLHNEKKYEDSSKYLQLANNLKLNINPSNSDTLINKSNALLIESNKNEITKIEQTNLPENIFIVGMPRSGSTLVESILSINPNINDLGEINILEQSFLKRKRNEQESPLAVLYWNKVNSLKSELKITTNKWLYNYQYAGIISCQIPNAKIIHCYRNPLDNILSIYRTHFSEGNEYSSSLIDCARVYLDQEELMTNYKNRFRSKIYDLNYDLLVSNPSKEIKSLVSWLGWEWNDSYLSPHLNPRSVSTASNVQVRFQINSKSIGGWKNYKNMLRPAIKILTQTDRYRDLIS